MKYCEYCGRSNEDSAKYCIQCGQDISNAQIIKEVKKVTDDILATPNNTNTNPIPSTEEIFIDDEEEEEEEKEVKKEVVKQEEKVEEFKGKTVNKEMVIRYKDGHNVKVIVEAEKNGIVKEKKRHHWLWFLLNLLVLAGLLYGAYYFYNNYLKAEPNTTKLLSQYTFPVAGKNGEGEIEAVGDPLTPLMQALKEENPDNAEAIDALANSVVCEFMGGENGKLSNGDTVTYACSYNEELAEKAGVDYSMTKVNVAIRGLSE